MPVSALRAGAGGDQVTHAGKSGEGLRTAPHRYAETGNLRKPTGNQSRPRIVAGALAITHAHRDSDDVFQNAAQFATDEIGIGVNPEQAAKEQLLQFTHDDFIFHRDHAGSRLACDNFPRQVGAGQYPDRMTGQYVVDHFGHAHPCAQFEALGQADHRHPGPQMLAGLLQNVSEMLRRDTHHQHITACYRLFDRPGSHQLRVQTGPRQVLAVAVLRIDFGYGCLIPGPQCDRRITGDQGSNRCAPGTASEQCCLKIHLFVPRQFV